MIGPLKEGKERSHHSTITVLDSLLGKIYKAFENSESITIIKYYRTSAKNLI